MATSKVANVYDYVHNNGGAMLATIYKANGEDTGFNIIIEANNNEVSYIAPDATAHDNPTNLIEYIGEHYANHSATGSLFAGNAANNVIGNYNIYKHIILEDGMSLADIAGSQFYPHNDNTVVKVIRKPRVKVQPKAKVYDAEEIKAVVTRYLQVTLRRSGLTQELIAQVKGVVDRLTFTDVKDGYATVDQIVLNAKNFANKNKAKRVEFNIQSGGRGHKYLNLHRH